MSAAQLWTTALLEWAIPDEILRAAPESPWGFPSQLFAARAGAALQRPPTLSHRRALEALPPGGTLLDIGVGGGAASLPIAATAGLVVGVDSSAGMLEGFAQASAGLRVPIRSVLGSWPEAAGEAGSCDVAVCHHVLFNVPDLGPFVAAIARAARRRVVIEMTPEHPLAWMSDLWMQFHGVQRPTGPTHADAAGVVAEQGLDVHTEVGEGPPVPGGFARREDAVALVRKRLCLKPDDDEPLARALGERLAQRDGLWSAAPAEHLLVTLWWDR